MSDKNANLTIRIPTERRMELRVLSEKTGYSESSIVRGLIFSRLDEEKAKAVA